MAASYTVRLRATIPIAPDQSVVEVEGIRIAYRDSAPGSKLPVVILVHGSPGTGSVFRGLTPALTPQFRVIAPDLPGFGGSTRDLPDYSFRSHARYLIAMLDKLGIPSAQWVGFSMGGGVVLSAYDLAPARVQSIVMLSALGVQEEELLRSYWKNHVLHALQLGAIVALRVATPHFGWLDNFGLNTSYARNFYDSDQRPLRAVLARYKSPMLILHGKRDANVPLAAALEHHRLVPQSKLVLFDENHFMTFRNPGVYSAELIRFLNENAVRP